MSTEIAKDNQWWYGRSSFRNWVEGKPTIVLIVDGRSCQMTHSTRGKDGRVTHSFKFDSLDDRRYWKQLNGQTVKLELGRDTALRTVRRRDADAPTTATARAAKPLRTGARAIANAPIARGFWPAKIIHADWSIHPRKRWMVAASLENGRYSVSPASPVGDLRRLTADPNTVVGFDFPIGVPAAYAHRATITNFRSTLAQLGSGRWARFFDVAETAADISLDRPFYPMRPGGTSRQQLVDALGLKNGLELLRACERAGPHRPRAASPLFWTLGGQQVGKAAITGWRDVLTPALLKDEVALWPFDGAFADLVHTARAVIVETYPADACAYLGMTRPGSGWSKRRPNDRLAWSDHLLHWASLRPVDLQPGLVADIKRGFGSAPDGEDRFDALVGAFAMIEVAAGFQALFEPTQDAARVEGWLFGMPSG